MIYISIKFFSRQNSPAKNFCVVAPGKIRKDDYTVMIGHSGPVYGASFSPDRQFLLTCSEDKTGNG